MDRQTLQQLAEIRLKDAEALLAAGRWDGAYYLLGYSVECALKACIAKQFRLHEVPERKLVNSFYTHRLNELVMVSGIQAAIDDRLKTDPIFDTNWSTLQDWSEAARYNIGIAEELARELYDAVADETSGIYPWLKTYY